MESSLFRTRSENSIEEEMGRGAHVVHRDKGIARGTLGIAVFYGSLVGGTSSATVMAGAPLWTLAIPALLSAALGVFAITKAVVRTAVTSDEVIVRSGMKERRVPVAAISKAEILPGNMIAPRGVLLHYLEEGAARQLWMASRNPELLIEAIESARSDGRGATRVRVDAGEALENQTEHEEGADRDAEQTDSLRT